MKKIIIVDIKPVDIDFIKKVFQKKWGGDFVVSRGKIYKPENLKGFMAKIDGKNVGLITLDIKNKELEIISLDSFIERKGIGTSLLEKVINFAKKEGVKRVWLLTTNDNLPALRFYQKRGFNLVRVYPNALEVSRKIKPGIPLIGIDDIPRKTKLN